MKVKRKFFRELNKRQTALGLLLGAAAFLAPWRTEAAIVRQDGTNIGATNNVYQVYAESIVNASNGKNYGVNKFNTFNVEENHIANMYFKRETGSVVASSLLNFVNSKIEINGTINAIRNNKIDGHLYFFSKDGLMLGAKGVINAGALTVATPSQGLFNKLNLLNTDDFVKAYYKDIEDLNDASVANPIVFNNSGTIEIKGKINTYQGTTLRAPNIVVGDASQNLAAAINNNVLDFTDFVNIKDNAGNVVASGLSEANAKAEVDKSTGNVLLFAYANGTNYRDTNDSLIAANMGDNASKAEVVVAKDAKIINPMGGAVIQAVSVDKPTDLDRGLFGYDEDDFTVLNIAGINLSKTIADVSVDGSITGGAINIGANSTIVNSSASLTTAPNTIGASYGILKTVFKKALPDRFTQYVGVLDDNVLFDLLNSVKWAVSVAHADANVKIGETAILNAVGSAGFDVAEIKDGNPVYKNTSGMLSGGALAIKSSASASNVSKCMTQNGEHGDSQHLVDYLNLNVGWTDTQANSKVEIAGTLSSNGSASINSYAKTKEVSVNAIKPNKPVTTPGSVSQSAAVDLAAGVNTISDQALITVADTAKINLKNDATTTYTDANGVSHTLKSGDLSMKAVSEQSIDSSVIVAVIDGNTGVETTVNVVVSNNKAQIDVDGVISARNIDIDAQNTLTFNEIVSDNTYGVDADWVDIGKVVLTQKVTPAVKNFFKKSILGKETVESKSNEDLEFFEITDDNNLNPIDSTTKPKTEIKTKWANYFDFGAAIVDATQNNEAKVNIGRNAKLYDAVNAAQNTVVGLSAAESLSINATSTVADSYIRASSALMDIKEDFEKNPNVESQTQALISSAILVNVSNNTAEVNIADASNEASNGTDPAHKEYSLLQAKDISITANSAYEYGRQKSTATNFKEVWSQLKTDLQSICQIAGVGIELIEEIDDAMDKAFPSDTSDPTSIDDLNSMSDALRDLLEVFNSAIIYYDQYNATKGKLNNMFNDIKHALDAGYWVQSYAAASANAPKGNVNTPRATVAATIGVNVLNTNAAVNVGKGAVLKADKANGGQLEITAEASQTDTVMTGRTKAVSQFITGLTNSSGGDFGLGGTFNITQSNVKGEVNIKEDAQLEAKDIAVNGDAFLNHIGITYGGSKSESAGITGMVAYAGGKTAALVNVTKDATLTATNGLDLASKNETIVTSGVGDFSRGEASSVGISTSTLVFSEDSKVVVEEAVLSAKTLQATADTLGVITNLAIAGTAEGKIPNKKNENGTNTNANLTGNAQIGNDELNNTVDKVNDLAQNDQAGNQEGNNGQAGNEEQKANEAAHNAVKNNGLNNNAAAPKDDNNNAKVHKHTDNPLDKLNVSAVGSLAINVVSGTTSVDISKSTIKAEAAKLQAKDSAVIGAYSGSAALSINKELEQNKTVFGGNLSGAIAVNSLSKKTSSAVKDSNLNIQGQLLNEAQDSSVNIALGTALGMDLGGRNYPSADVGLSGSFNFVDDDVEAVLENNSFNEAASHTANVTNAAVDHAVMVAGGVTAAFARSSVAAGTNVAVNDIKHSVEAKIKGGKYANVGTLASYALSDATQVGVAVSGGVTAGKNSTYVSSNSAVAINYIKNSLSSVIEDSELSANAVDARAFTGSIDAAESNAYLQEASGKTSSGSYGKNSYINSSELSFIDFHGAQVAEAAGINDVSADKAMLDKAGSAGSAKVMANGTDANGNNNTATVATTSTKGVYSKTTLTPSDSSSTQVTGAIAVTTTLNNSEGVNVTGGAVVAIGVISNNVKTELKNNNITANSAQLAASSGEDLVTVAGQANFTRGNAAGGLAYAQNDVQNNTSTKVLGNAIIMGSGDLEVRAEDESNAWTAALGAAATLNQSSAAVNGSVAVNTGTKDIQAVIDNLTENNTTIASSINKANNISVTTLDETSQKAIAGDFAAGNGYAAVGGAIATNNIGTDVDNRQENEARLSNTTITIAGEDKDILVAAEDKSGLYSFALGASVGVGSKGAAVDANAATGVIHKAVEAKSENLVLQAENKKTDLTVKANNYSTIVTSADVAAITTANAAVAGAVAVTESFIDTKAEVKNLAGSLDKSKAAQVKSTLVTAQNKTEAYNVGIDAALTVVEQGATVVGNFITNRMDNHTLASLEGANLRATGNVGVIADSDEVIRNYAGTFAGTDGAGYAAVGASVAVNLLNGDTKASIDNSNIIALGQDTGITVKEYQEKEKAETESRDAVSQGLVVDADGNRAVYNVLASISESIGTTAGVGVFGSVATNHIGGETSALVSDTNINNTNDKSSDVYVDAKDNSKLDSHVGVAAIGGGFNAGVGVGGTSNTDLMERTVKAEIAGSSNQKAVLNGNKVLVHALNHSEELSSLSGVNVGGALYGSAAVGLNISVTQHKGEAIAHIQNVEGTTNGTQVGAQRINRAAQYVNSVQLSGSIGSGSVGLGVAYVDDISTTEASIENSTLKHYGKSGEDKVLASNNSRLINEMVEANVAVSLGAGVGALINVNNIDNKVSANLINSELGSQNAYANKVSVNAKNKFEADYTQVGVNGSPLGAVGVGVEVTTVDSTVATNVLGSTVYASDVDIKAEEERTLDATAVTATVGCLDVNTNVMVVNMGSTVQNAYSASYVRPDGKQAKAETITLKLDDANDKSKYYIDGLINSTLANQEAANTGLKTNANVNVSDTDKVASGVTAYSKGGYTGTVTVKSGNNNGANSVVVSRGVSNNLKDSTINAANNANFVISTINNVDMNIGAGLVGIVDAVADVGVLDVTDKSLLNIDNTHIKAKNTNISTSAGGKLNSLTVQAGASAINLNAAVTDVDRRGGSTITITNNSHLENTDTLEITSKDTTTTKANVQGYAITAARFGALVGNANDYSNNIINISGSTLKANERLAVKGERSNTVSAEAFNVYAGITNATAVWVQADNGGYTGDDDSDYTKVTIDQNMGYSKIFGTGNALEAKTIDITALNNANAKAENHNIEGALLPTVGYTTVRTTNAGGAVASLGATEIKTDSINVKSSIGDGNKGLSQADLFGVNVGLGAISVNEAYARSFMESTADLSVGQIAGYSTSAPDVSINALSQAVVDSTAEGYNVGVGMASGTNKAMTKDQAFASASFSAPTGGSGAVILNNLTVNADTNDKAKAYANGDGGGIAEVSPEAAYTDNKGYFTADTNITGNININNQVTATAKNNINTELNADAIQAAVYQGSGTEGYSHINSEANVNLDTLKLNNLGNKAANFLATNNFNLDQRVYGNGYGGITVDVAKLYTYNIARAAVNVTNNSIINSAGDINMATDTRGTITSNGYVYAAAIVFGDANLYLKDEITTDNSININSDSEIKTTALNSNITLSASESDLQVQSHALAENDFSASGVTTTSIEDKYTRKNTVNVAGALDSMNDINLYAGKNVQGGLGSLSINSTSEAYNRTLIPFSTSPDLSYIIDHENLVNIASTGSVQSVRNVELYGDTGKNNVYTRTGTYRLYDSDVNQDSFVASTGGELESSEVNKDKIIVDGTVIAGQGNNQTITIGQNGDLIFTTQAGLVAVKAGNNANQNIYSVEEALAQNRVTVAADGTSLSTTDLRFGQFDYSNALLTRYNELDALLANYSENKNADAYKGYLEEYKRIEALMKQMKLMDDDKKLTDTMKVDYVEIPDLVAAGGDIRLNTSNVVGSSTGKLIAKGTPTIEIINNTNLALVVNDITVADDGGKITYNGQSVGNNEQIKNINLDKNADVALNEVEGVGGTSGVITIQGNYNGQSIYYKDSDNNTYSVNPKADINIQGLVNSNDGSVTISSAHNNINVYSVKSGQTAGVSGRTISISAAYGSVTQGNIDGIVNVGGNPEDIYDYAYRTLISKIKNQEDEAVSATNKVYSDSEKLKGEGTIIAGENIYIDATDININGVLQSGYNKYEATIELTDKVSNKMKNLEAEAEGNKGQWGFVQPSDEAILSNNHYRVIEGADIWDSENNCYKRQVDVYYNAYTKTFLVPDIDAHGGQIYLSGRISSTGNGKIICLDGAYDISINSKIEDIDLKLGKLISNDVSGKITIVDKAKNSTTVINKGSGISSYNPQSGLRYNWTSGQNMTTKVEYTKETMERLWGAGKEREQDYSETLKQWEDDTDTQSTNLGNSVYDKKPGATIDADTNALASKDSAPFYVVYNNKILNNYTSEPTEETWSTGIFNCHKHYRYTWYEETGSAQSYLGSLKADNTIGISFMGKSTAQEAAIDVTAQGSVYLRNTVGFANYTSNDKHIINISSVNGSIIQENNSVLKADKVLLKAERDIKAINNGVDSGVQILAGDSLWLGATNKSSGKVLLDVSRSYGKAGVVQIAAQGIGSASASYVSLVSEGSVEHSGAIFGHRIDAASEHGSLNIEVAVGQNTGDYVNAEAENSITLVQSQNDLRLGTVKSSSGDVSITASSGSIVDGLPAVELDDKTLLKARLEAMGLIAGTETNAELVAKKEAVLAKLKAQGHVTSDKYQSWNLDKLLYSIEESKINPRAGVVDYGKAANVTGKNITLSAGKGIGADGSTTKTYKISELGSNVEALKEVALANSLSVTWNDAADTVTITDKNLLGVQTLAANNAVNATASNGNIYLEGRKDVNYEIHNTDLKLGNISASGGNVIVTSQGSITNSNKLVARDLDLRANGNIGGVFDITDLNNVTYFNMGISGILSATALGDIAIRQQDRSLTVGAISTKGDIFLHSNSSVFMSAWDDNAAVQSFIRSEADGNIVLRSDYGSLGAEGRELRFINSRQNSAVITTGEGENATTSYKNTVSLFAGVNSEYNQVGVGEIYVKGMSSSDLPKTSAGMKPAEGTLYIKDVQAKSIVDIAVNGDLDLLGTNTIETTTYIRLATTNDFALNQNLKSKDITIQSGNNVTVEGANLEASNDINVVADNGNLDIRSGSMKATNKLELASNEKNINITSLSLNANEAKLFALNGQISQGAAVNSGLTMQAGQTLKAEALNGIALDNQYNDLSKVSLENNAAGDILFTNGGNKTVEVTIVSNGTIYGNVKVHNAANGSVNTLKVNGAVNATGFVDIANYEGSIILGGDGSAVDVTSITGKSVSILAKDALSNNISLTATNGELKLESLDSNINNNGSLNAGAAGVAGNGGSITLVATNGSIDNSQELNARDNITLKALSDIAVTKKLTAGKDIQVVSSGKVSINNFDSSIDTGNITLENAAAVANAVKSVESLNGSVTITGGTGVDNDGFIKAKGDVVLTSTGASANVDNKRSIWSTDGNVIISSQNNINNARTIVAQNGGISFTAANNISSNGDKSYLAASKSVAMTATCGNIDNKAVLRVADSVTMLAGGSLTTTGDITAGKAVSLQSGSALSAGRIVSNTSAVTIAAGGSTQITGGVSAKEDVTLTAGGAFSSSGAISGKNVTVSAGNGDLTNAYGIAASGMVILTANAGSVINSGSLSAAGGIVLTAKASESVAQSGSVTNGSDIVTTSGNVTITADKDITNGSGSISTGQGDVSLEAKTGSINNASSITAQSGKVNLIADVNLSNSGAASVINAGKSIVLQANKGSLSNSSAFNVADFVMMTAGTALTTTGSIMAGNAVTLNAGADLSAVRVVSNDSFVKITAAGAINTSGGISAKENVTVNAGGSLSNSGAIVGKNVSAVAGTGNLVNTDGITAQGEVALEAKTGSVYNNAVLNGVKDITVKASTDVVNNKSIITKNGDIVITAGQNVKNLAAFGENNVIAAERGSITVTAANELKNAAQMKAAGTVNLSAHDVINTGDITTKTGSVIIRATNDAVNSGSVALTRGNVTISANNNVANNGNITLNNGDVAISADNGDAVNTGIISIERGSINISSINGEVNNKINADISVQEGNVVLTSTNGAVNNSGSTTTVGNVVLVGKGNVTNNNSLLAQNGVLRLESTGSNVINNGNLGAGGSGTIAGSVELLAEQGSITMTANKLIMASGHVTLSSKNNIVNSDGIFAGDYVSITSSAGIVTNNSVLNSANSYVSISAQGIENNNDITANESVVLNSSNIIANIGSMLSETSSLLLSAVGITGSNAITNTGTFKVKNGTIALTAEHGNIVNNGVFLAGDAAGSSEYAGSISMIARDGAISNNKALAARHDITLTSSADIDNDKGILAGGNIQLKSTAGDVTNITAGKNIVSVGGAVTLEGINVNNTSNVTAANGVYLYGSGAVTNSGTIKLEVSKDSLTSNIVQAAGVNAQADADKVVGSGEVVLRSVAFDKQTTEFGEIDVVVGGGTVTNSGSITAKGNITLEAWYDVTNNANSDATGLTSNGGMIKLHSYKRNVFNYDALGAHNPQEQANASIALLAENGSITNVQILNATGFIELNAMNDIANTQNISAGSFVSITSTTGNVSNSGNVEAGTGVSMTASTGSLSNTGNITAASGDIIFTAKQSVENTGLGVLHAKDGNITLFASGQSLTTDYTSVTNDATLLVNNGTITLEAEHGNVENTANGLILAGDAQESSSVEGAGSISMIARDGSIVNSKALGAKKNITLISSADINNTMGILAGGNIRLVSTGGNVNNTTTNRIITSVNGSVTIIGKDITNSSNISAGSNVTVNSSGNVSNSGNITANENVSLEATGNITNSSNIVATKNVNLGANNAVNNSGNINAVGNAKLQGLNSVANSGTIEAGLGASLISGVGTVSNSRNITVEQGNILLQAEQKVENTDSGKLHTSNGDIRLIAAGNGLTAGTPAVSNNAMLLVNNGTIRLEAAHGDVENTANGLILAGDAQGSSSVAGAGSISMIARDGSIVNSKALGAKKDITLISSADINNTMGILAGGNIRLVSTGGNVNNTTTNKKITSVNGSVTIIGKDITNYSNISAGSNVTVNSSGNVSNSGNITADENVSLESTGSITNSSNIVATKNVNLGANNAVNNSGNINAVGNAKLQGLNSVANSGTIEAGLGASLISRAGTVINSNVITVAQGNILLQADQTVVNTDSGRLQAENGDVKLFAAGNNVAVGGAAVTNSANLKVNNGTIILEAMNGNVINTSTGNLLAGNADGSGEGGSISLIAHEGAIVNSKTVVAKNNITLLSSAGISNANSFLAGGDISIESTAGGFVGYNEHFINSRQGSITIKANTNINNDSSINAAKDIKLYANEDITSNNTLNAGNRLDVSSMDGAISLSQGATAGQGGMFIVSGDLKDENTTKGGDITINGELLVNNISTSAGDIVVFTSNGDIKLNNATINDGDDSLIRIYSAAGNINANTLLATAGSVDVGAKTGNINVNTIDAAMLAATGTSAQGGNIVLGTIKGNAVVLYTENGNSSIKADSVVAKKYIAVQGNKIDAPIDKENSGVEALIMDIRGTSGKKTLPNVILSFAGNKDYNCEYNDERMLVEYQGYKTSIYGSDPKFDGSNAIYYASSEAQAGGAGSGTGLDLSKLFFQYDDKMAIIEELRKAVNSVKPGTAGAEGFLKSAIYLHYDSDNRQHCNALLLHLDNYFYVYGQRKSAEDLGRKLLDEKTSLLFANYYQPKLFDYNRIELVVDKFKSISPLSQEEPEDYLQLSSSEDRLELN